MPPKEDSAQTLQDLWAIWNWLPVFRVVAETQHISRAAKLLHISPPAVSRTIRLLEENLERPLFNRVGRNIALNSDGQQLLSDVRKSTRHIQEALRKMKAPTDLSGSVHISASGPSVRSFLVPALAKLRDKHPDLVPHLHNCDDRDTARLLSLGELDVVFQTSATAKDGLSIEKLGEISTAIYCGRSHPLFTAPDPVLVHVCDHEFAAPMPNEEGISPDGWPPEKTRRIGLYIDQLQTAVEVCLSGQYLAVLPDETVQDHVPTGALRRIAMKGLAPSPMYAVRRPTFGPTDRAKAVIEAVRLAVD